MACGIKPLRHKRSCSKQFKLGLKKLKLRVLQHFVNLRSVSAVTRWLNVVGANNIRPTKEENANTSSTCQRHPCAQHGCCAAGRLWASWDAHGHGRYCR